MGFDYRRLPAKDRKISEIDPENDIRIRILGKIVDMSKNALIIDDGTAKAEIITEEPASDEMTLARIFARVLPLEEGYELRAEVIQDMKDVDIELYKKVFLQK